MYAIPGGLIGVGLTLPSQYTAKDMLVGQVLGDPENMPEVWNEMKVKCHLMPSLLGLNHRQQVEDQEDVEMESSDKIKSLKAGEELRVNIGSAQFSGTILKVEKKTKVTIKLNKPACSNIGDNISLSRKIDDKFRLIGYAQIKEGRFS